MTKDQAIFLAHIAHDAIKYGDAAKCYGTFGVEKAMDAIDSLAKEWGFESPVVRS